MKAVLAICAVAAIATSCLALDYGAYDFPRHHQLAGYTFKQYVADANKQYQSESEYVRREKIFNDHLAEIKRHNADKTQSYKRGINQFTDWTMDEFRSYNKAKPARLAAKGLSTLRKPDMTVPLPRFVDYRLQTNPPVLTAIKNQGACGNCWAHSTVETMESMFALQFGQLPVLSTQQVTSCTQTMFGCGGGDYGQGWTYIMKNSSGLNEEWTYPFVDFFAKGESMADTQKCYNVTKKFPVMPGPDGKNMTFSWWPKANVSSFHHPKPNNGFAMLEALARVGPQSISVAASTWSDYESGIFQNNYTNMMTNFSWQEIDHAVQMVGYGYDYDLNMDYWIVRNSWGTNFGEQGFIRLARPAVEPCGNITGYEVCGTSGCLSDPAFAIVSKLKKQNL